MTESDPNARLETASSLPAHYYVAPEAHQRDLDEVLAPSWQKVAPASELSGSGDHIVRVLGRRPVLIVRQPSGELKGFYNVCRHRAGPIATCDGRGATRLRCRYHGWVYGLDGRLTKAPEMEDAEGFDPSEIALRLIDVREWGGMVFARAGSGPQLEEVLDGIDAIVDIQSLAKMRYHHSTVHPVESDWKVYVDNFLEGYHLPFVHPALTQAVDFPQYRSELGRFWSLQRSPISDADGAYEAGEALYFFIFPNTMFNILPGRVQTNRVVPDGPGRCQVEFSYYYAPGNEERAEKDEALSDAIQQEDRLICEKVQKGLESGAYEPGRLSPRHEAAVWHWQSLLRASVG